jgi:hypothetical protein
MSALGQKRTPLECAHRATVSCGGFMKTLKVEAVYLMDYQTFEDVTADLQRLYR